MDFYDSYGIPMVVADGTRDVGLNVFNRNINYIYMPGEPINNRILKALECVKTRYVCFAADDDFISPDFLLESLGCMQIDPSISTVVGRRYYFFENNFYEWVPCDDQATSIANDDEFKRIKEYFATYFAIFYSPIKTELAREFFEATREFPIEHANITELMFSLRVLLEGKIMKIGSFSQAREIPALLSKERLAMSCPYQLILKNPNLGVSMDKIAKNWCINWQEGMFEKLVVLPWYHSPVGPGRMDQPFQKIKANISAILGERLSKKIKPIILRMIGHKGYCKAEAYCDREQLKKIEAFLRGYSKF